MRATLTIDDDVAAMLEQLRGSRDASPKELINEALRRGLRDMAAPAAGRPPYQTPSVDLGTPRITNIDNISDVLAIIESTPVK
jgi:hypothetical protein